MLNYIIIGLIATTSLFNLNIALKLEEWSDDDFDENLAKHGKVFVKFFAPWCGHCKRLAPEWEKAANRLGEKVGAMVKVDCTTNGEATCKRFQVQGYPTLKFIKYNDKDTSDHKVIDYSGGRDENSLHAFATKHFAPSLTELKDYEVSKFINHDSLTTFVLFTSSKVTKAYKLFEELADKFLGGARFGVSFMNHPSKIIPNAVTESLVYQRGKKLITKLEAENGVEENLSKFFDFIKYSLNGRVALRNSESEEFIPRPLATVFIAQLFETNSSYFKMLRNRLYPVAEKFPDIQFAVASSKDHIGFVENIGFNPKVDELFFVIEDSEGKLYVPKSSIKFADLKTLPDLMKQFLADYTAGKLEAYYKSEPIPEKQEPGKPMVVVAKTLKSVVSDPTKNVFIKMYAPWCGHCKHLEPFWNELAEKYKDDPSVVIAKYNAEANGSPLSEYEITGFPTLFFSKAGTGGKKPIQYSGARTLDALIAFVDKQVPKAEESKDEL